MREAFSFVDDFRFRIWLIDGLMDAFENLNTEIIIMPHATANFTIVIGQTKLRVVSEIAWNHNAWLSLRGWSQRT